MPSGRSGYTPVQYQYSGQQVTVGCPPGGSPRNGFSPVRRPNTGPRLGEADDRLGLRTIALEPVYAGWLRDEGPWTNTVQPRARPLSNSVLGFPSSFIDASVVFLVTHVWLRCVRGFDVLGGVSASPILLAPCRTPLAGKSATWSVLPLRGAESHAARGFVLARSAKATCLRWRLRWQASCLMGALVGALRLQFPPERACVTPPVRSAAAVFAVGDHCVVPSSPVPVMTALQPGALA